MLGNTPEFSGVGHVRIYGVRYHRKLDCIDSLIGDFVSKNNDKYKYDFGTHQIRFLEPSVQLRLHLPSFQ